MKSLFLAMALIMAFATLSMSASVSLQSTSPAKNVGYDTTATVPYDLLGTARTATPSLGAFEQPPNAVTALTTLLKGILLRGTTFKH